MWKKLKKRTDVTRKKKKRRKKLRRLLHWLEQLNSWLWLLIYKKLIEPTWTFAIIFTKMNPNSNLALSFFILITLVLCVSAAHAVRKLATLESLEVRHIVDWKHVFVHLLLKKSLCFNKNLKVVLLRYLYLLSVVSPVGDCRFLSHQTFHRRPHQVMAGLMRTSVSVHATTAWAWLVAFNSHQLVSLCFGGLSSLCSSSVSHGMLFVLNERSYCTEFLNWNNIMSRVYLHQALINWTKFEVYMSLCVCELVVLITYSYSYCIDHLFI